MASLLPQVDEYLNQLPSWQRHNLSLFRVAIHDVCPDVTEDIKWGVPVFLLNGKTLFSMAAFRAHTKFNFLANGALLSDPDKLFNNGLESKKSRSVDLNLDDTIDSKKLKALVQQSVDIALS